MWNNIATEKRMEGLSSTYYALIANKEAATPIIPQATVPLPGPTDDTDDEEGVLAAPQPDESYVRQNRHKRTRAPELVRPGTGASTRPSNSRSLNNNIGTSSVNRNRSSATHTPRPSTNSQFRLQTSLQQIAQENGVSQGINLTHSFPRKQLPYSPPSITNVTERQPLNVVTRVQSQTYVPDSNRMFSTILKTPTRSDYQNFIVTRSSLNVMKMKRPSSPVPTQSDESCSSSGRSVFDVEEDSKFEFYVEDQESNTAADSNIKLAEPETTKARQVGQSNEVTSIEENDISQQAEENANEPSGLDSPQPSVIFYSNPRYGSRYACKDVEAISAVNQRNYDLPQTCTKGVDSGKVSRFSIPARRYSTSEKLQNDICDRRLTLTPIRRCRSAFSSPENDKILPEGDQYQHRSPKNTGYKDSTQFIFPPVLSESGLSVCSKRKSCSGNELDDDLPDPDLTAIHEYNLELLRAKTNPSGTTSGTSKSRHECSSTYALGDSSSNAGSSRFKVGSRSSSGVVTNIPCNSWMMFPLRVLPGEMVPWGLLLYVPLILLLMVVIGYYLVILSPFAA